MNSLKMAWLPTASMVFLEVLAEYFPRHHLFLADWNQVAVPIQGYNAPTVQGKSRMAPNVFRRVHVGLAPGEGAGGEGRGPHSRDGFQQLLKPDHVRQGQVEAGPGKTCQVLDVGIRAHKQAGYVAVEFL